MEALVAIGLAGNVAQFVQFSGQLFSLAKEIKKKGTSSSLLELRNVAEGLMKQTRVIATRLKANTATLQQEEQHLLDVATDCEKAGEEFIAYIDDLIKTSKPSSCVGSMQSSVKIKLRHNQIEAHIARLDRLQGSLCLATTLSLRTRETGNHQEILEHLRSIEAGNNASQQSDSHLIRALGLLQDLVQQQSGPKLDMLQKQMESCMENIQIIRSTITDTYEVEILRLLDFRQRAWRFEEVEEAHRTTFEWIFQKPRADTPWHDFGGYLSGTEVSLPYFINGKAGSGKSTLMKYIISHSETKARLQKWAGQYKLFSPHFFFWNVGTQLQKSHTGLLRSLLHSVLDKYRDLIPAVFPSLYTGSTPISGDEALSYIELKNAFERMKIRSASFLRICIFIDGVDEFEGDHRDMATFLCSMASSTIKVVVSSRPINACLNVFKDCPMLRLQDLTHDDMRVFIRDRLSSHPMMAELQHESPEMTATLKAEIQEKAEGVFLWVRLVTRLLLRGLEDGDDFDDLLPKLRALPNDLWELYDRMMKKMPPEYQVQASQMFQIFDWWRLYGNDEPLELLLLSFAIQQPHIAVSSNEDAWDTQKRRSQSERMASRVRSRCCGLLEVREIPNSSMFWPSTPVVAYLHRSVAEFVTSPYVWERIHNLTIKTKFSAGTQIACGLLSILKTSHLLPNETESLRVPKVSSRKAYSERILDLAMDVCRRDAAVEESFILQYMKAIDNTMVLINRDLRWKSLEQQTHPFSAHWSTRMAPIRLESEIRHLNNNMPLWTPANIRSFAAHRGVLPYLKALDRSEKLAYVESLVLFVLGSWVDEKHLFRSQRGRETLSFLLEILCHRSKLGIETTIGQKTLWELAMIVAYDWSNKLWRYDRENREDTVITQLPERTFGLPYHETKFCKKLEKYDLWPSSARDEKVVQHNDLFWGQLGQDAPMEPSLTDRTFGGSHATSSRGTRRKRSLEEEAPGVLETKPTRNKQQKQENGVGWLGDAGFTFHEVLEEPLWTPQRKCFELNPFEEKNQRVGSGQDLQDVVDLLQLFLSFTNKQTEIINKVISTPKRPAFTPFAILRKALVQGRKEKLKWASESQYQFLYQLAGLPETC